MSCLSIASFGIVGVVKVGSLDAFQYDICDEAAQEIQETCIGTDDVTGEYINPQLIWDARQDELRGFEKQEVYVRVPRWKAKSDPEGVVVGVRWVDCNKGSSEAPDVRSRLVAQEFASKDN